MVVKKVLRVVFCAVGICEVKGKPELVRHDSDAFFRIPRTGLLPLSFCSISTTTLRTMTATKQSASDYDACY